MDARRCRAPVYFMRVLCPVRRRAQTCALSLNDDHGDAAEAGCASPPRSGKPDGLQASPLEPWVQGRLARIAMAEGVHTPTGPCRLANGPVFLSRRAPARTRPRPPAPRPYAANDTTPAPISTA